MHGFVYVFCSVGFGRHILKNKTKRRTSGVIVAFLSIAVHCHNPACVRAGERSLTESDLRLRQVSRQLLVKRFEDALQLRELTRVRLRHRAAQQRNHEPDGHRGYLWHARRSRLHGHQEAASAGHSAGTATATAWKLA